MSVKYQAYPEYKDSGIEWLGEVPNHWFSTKIKYGYKITLGKMLQKEAKTSEDKLKPYLKAINIQPTGISLDTVGQMWFSHNDLKSLKLLNGDVLISEGGDVGRVAIWREELPDCYIQNAINRARPLKNRSSRYLYYWMNMLKGSDFIDILCNKATIAHYTAEKVEFSPLFMPPDEEARFIANFLDHETAKIDTLIEKQQQLIKLLKEKRQAVISHAVTKGLNPSTPMRDSGVEWLGEVPEHWDVNNINYVLNAIGDVDHYMPQSVEKGIPYVMTGDLKELASSINFEDCKQVSHKDYLKLSNKIKSSRGDVIMARYATIGTASYIDVDADFLVSYSCVTIKPNLSKVFGLYLFYYFKSDAFLQGIQNQINTNTQGNVGVNDLKKLKVALPTLAEQSRIIEYLQSKINKLNSISDRAQAAIGLMQERRTALISAAVTGKIDVRNWQPSHD